MASVFDLKKQFEEKHGVAESTLMLGTVNGAHFYNMVSNVALDNGSVSKFDVENYEGDDYFATEVPAIEDEIVLLLNPVKIYEEFATQCQDEAYFYNAAGELIRAYEVKKSDRFSLSREAFKEDITASEVAVGKYVVVDGTGYKLDVVDTDPNAAAVTNGFVGKIVKVNANGTYLIIVKRNKTVE